MNGEWIDRLARVVAGGMPRREVLRIFAATTATAVFGSWVRPGRGTAASLGQGNDPGCSGIRTFYRVGCPKPVPKRGFKAPFNGCGPAGGIYGVKVTLNSPLYIADFSPACNGHDIGYSTCNRLKGATDAKFYNDMVAICAKDYSGSAVLDSVGRAQCNINAQLFYKAVSQTEVGDDAYQAGQEEACDCCDECPGGALKCPLECCRPGDTWICGSSGRCCQKCQPGWHSCPYPNQPRCGFGCCMPDLSVCCPGVNPGDLRCCSPKGKGCYKGGCG